MKKNQLTDLVERSHSDGHFNTVLAVHIRGFGPHGAAGWRESDCPGTLSEQLLPHREQHGTVSGYTTTVTRWAQCVRKIPKLGGEKKYLIEKKQTSDFQNLAEDPPTTTTTCPA